MRQGHFVYGRCLSVCTLSWRNDEEVGTKLVQSAVDCCYWPVYEIENGKTTINYNPEDKGRRIPVRDFLAMMGKTKHLLKPQNADLLSRIEEDIQERWERIRARNDSPVL